MTENKIDYNIFHQHEFATLGDGKDYCPPNLSQEAQSLAREGKKPVLLPTLLPGDTIDEKSLSCKDALYPADSAIARLAPAIEKATVHVAAYDSDQDALAANQPGRTFHFETSTGVVFDPRGYVMVNRHLKAGLHYYVEFANNQSLPLTIIANAKDSDLALAKIESPDLDIRYSTFPIDASKNELPKQKPIAAAGFAGGRHHLAYSFGELTGMELSPADNAGTAKQQCPKLNTFEGQSGSGVIDLNTGKMIGVISASKIPLQPGDLWALPKNYYSLMVRKPDLVNFYLMAERYINSTDKRPAN
jgi:S1-C subfamily serine protease